MKREFVTPVSQLFVTCDELEFLKESLFKLGYDLQKCVYNLNCVLVTNYDGIMGRVGIVQYCDRLNVNRCHIEKYNRELFLALANMSKGPDHYPGEWVKIKGFNGLYRVEKTTMLGMYLFCGENKPQCAIFHSDLTKATKEEIVEWFTKDEILESNSEPSGFNPDAGVSANTHSGIVTSGCVKIPLGIQPRKLHEETRIRDLMAAIDRHLTEGLNIPEKWQDELNDLLYSRVDREVEA